MRRFVFVPILGDDNGAGRKVTDDEWQAMPHVKAWGFFDEGENRFTPLHTDPAVESLAIGTPIQLFEQELALARDVADDDDIPTELAVKLARMALLPVRQADCE